MKNIIIVSKGNTAVAVGDNNQATITKSGVSAFLANLEVVKDILLSIPTEATSSAVKSLPAPVLPVLTYSIAVPDTIPWIISGT